MPGYSTAARAALRNAFGTHVGNGAKLRIYSGARPATGGSPTTLLGEFTCATPFAPTTATAILSPTLPADVIVSAGGTASWARLVKSDGTTFVSDYSVGLSGAEVNLSSLTVASGDTLSVTSWSMTDGNS